MAKRLLHYLSPSRWGQSLAFYGSGRLWRDVASQAVRSRWAEVTAAIAFLWLLGLLGASFVLLQGAQTAIIPPSALALAQGFPALLGVVDPTPQAGTLGRWGAGFLGLGAWFCLVAGSRQLHQLLAATFGQGAVGGPAADTWRCRLIPWGMTLLGLGLAGLVFSLLGSGTEGAIAPGRWSTVLRLGRWALAIGVVAVGLALVYRLVPPRWSPSLALWPGVRVAVALGLLILGLRHWGLSWLARQGIAYDLLLVLGINLVTLYGLILLVPVGAQVNLSTRRHRSTVQHPWGRPVPTPPPPSFDSFKIKRRE
ncbi:hypothetical protein PGN35_005290 [Nodosilinea sp. PGN35]|uniref:hypothetical protein n=1 Tax=Nodosilinea sp. PGN35 TaxID=3020489 RepID=UPI0023B25005|nr:hypothetical protein [Nodosilinea sp. TSF1-S3]MDF0367652.1 hypothetical protein [Nodosilinea sp. TSF1-S3]